VALRCGGISLGRVGFKDLEVWKESKKLAVEVYKETNKP